MKKSIIIALVGICPMIAIAQSAIDAYQLSQSDLKGTARFMSMAGAFGALGGDLSTLNQNPAGIGVYRSSEIGMSLNLDFQGTKTNSMGSTMKSDQTKFTCNNFGYVGAVKLDSEVMPYFTWGASFNRVASFDRKYRGYIPHLNTSMSNYVANFTNGWDENELKMSYYDSYAPWLSILAYDAYLIHPTGRSSYDGLYQNGTTGNAMFDVREKGYVDEYSINFGGNIMNTLYWGIGFGFTDISFTSAAYYDEELTGARVVNTNADGDEIGTTTGNGWYELGNYQHVRGNGFNFKAGLIFKPINELRLGIAVHTPTFYDLQHEAYAGIKYSYAKEIQIKDENGDMISEFIPTKEDYVAVDEGYYTYYDYDLRTPWRLILSAAGVIGGRGILSMDYEYVGYNSMRVSDPDGNEYTAESVDIDNYYQASHIIRLGGEYRVTPSFSLRAGYSYQSSPAKDVAIDNDIYIYTSGTNTLGTNPAYTFDSSIQYITAGCGYRYKGFYIDMAYVHKTRQSTYRAFSSFGEYDAMLNDYDVNERSNYSKIKDNNNQLVLSVGYKF